MEPSITKEAFWKLVDAYELGYEYEFTHCKAKVNTTKKGEILTLKMSKMWI